MGSVVSAITNAIVKNIDADFVKNAPKLGGKDREENDGQLERQPFLSRKNSNNDKEFNFSNKGNEFVLQDYHPMEDYFSDFLYLFEEEAKWSHMIDNEIEPNQIFIPNVYEDIAADSFLPVINLLPRLTEDLALRQRRPKHVRQKKRNAGLSIVQRIYAPQETWSPLRR